MPRRLYLSDQNKKVYTVFYKQLLFQLSTEQLNNEGTSITNVIRFHVNANEYLITSEISIYLSKYWDIYRLRACVAEFLIKKLVKTQLKSI